jgi:hypothetical protein
VVLCLATVVVFTPVDLLFFSFMPGFLALELGDVLVEIRPAPAIAFCLLYLATSSSSAVLRARLGNRRYCQARCSGEALDSPMCQLHIGVRCERNHRARRTRDRAALLNDANAVYFGCGTIRR